MRGTVAVGMSGGVDSSVAALLLKEKGYNVIGVTLKLSSANNCDLDIQVCCSPQDIKDAKRVANYLGIEHYVLDWEELFRKEVIDYFVESYREGLTPNPCVFCNRRVKTGRLAKYVRVFLNSDYFATGHYIRKSLVDSFHLIRRGMDKKKDQSYFMALLEPEIVNMLLFPLGELTKEEVRNIAQKYKLPVSSKKDSFEICFTYGKTPGEFLEENSLIEIKKGKLKHIKGEILGEHRGLAYYTIGQRRGLGIRWDRPLYVIEKDGKTNTIIVGEEKFLYTDSVEANSLNIFLPYEKWELDKIYVQGRYNQNPIPVEEISIENNRIKVKFKEPQKKFAPGQILAVYQGEDLIAGGVIS